jgi:hypothetical protein
MVININGYRLGTALSPTTDHGRFAPRTKVFRTEVWSATVRMSP